VEKLQTPENARAEISPLVSHQYLVLQPQEHVTRHFTLTGIQDLNRCVIEGDYNSNSSSVLAAIAVRERFPGIDDPALLEAMKRVIVSQRRWSELVRNNNTISVPRNAGPPQTDRLADEEAKYVNLYDSDDYEDRRKVHFERQIPVDASDLLASAIVVKNVGHNHEAKIEIVVNLACPALTK
jgi:hypothetical protein